MATNHDRKLTGSDHMTIGVDEMDQNLHVRITPAHARNSVACRIRCPSPRWTPTWQRIFAELELVPEVVTVSPLRLPKPAGLLRGGRPADTA